jgi:TonB family protein
VRLLIAISNWTSTPTSTSTSKSKSISISKGLGLALALGSGLTGCAEEAPVTPPETLTVESPFHYPVALWDSAVEGETVLMVHVTDMGGVDSVYVLEESGEAAFDSAAVAGGYELKFAPGRRGDRRIAMWARLPVRFRLPEPGTGGTE